jgi:hypothetical protein
MYSCSIEFVLVWCILEYFPSCLISLDSNILILVFLNKFMFQYTFKICEHNQYFFLIVFTMANFICIILIADPFCMHYIWHFVMIVIIFFLIQWVGLLFYWISFESLFYENRGFKPLYYRAAGQSSAMGEQFNGMSVQCTASWTVCMLWCMACKC